MPINLNNTGNTSGQTQPTNTIPRRTMTVSEYNQQNPNAQWGADTKVAFSYGGKTYALTNKQYDWITSRYKNDWSGSYGHDLEDQRAQAEGRMSSSIYNSYKNNGIDYQLRELGLPSVKNLEKYLGEYQSWHTGGIDQVFGNRVSPGQWTKMKEMYKQDWKYEDTAEDQMRKNRGLMPSALESKYTDTEIDDQLKAGGLPPISEYDKYRERYNNYHGIDTLYRNAAGAYTATRLMKDANTNESVKNDNKSYTVVVDPESGRTETRTGKEWYAKAFYDELGREDENGNKVYGSIIPLLKKSTYETTDEDYVDPTKSYIEEMDKMFSAYGKAEGLAEDYANHSAFSYDDFVKNYDDYYNRYYKNYKFSNGLTIDEVNAIMQREQDEERTRQFYDIKDRWFDGDNGIDAFIERYQKDYPPASGGDAQSYYEQMFSNMYDNGVSDKIVRKVRNTLRRSSKTNSEFNSITKAYASVKPKNENAQAELWANVNYDPNDNTAYMERQNQPEETLGADNLSVGDWSKELRKYVDDQMVAGGDETIVKTARDAIENAFSGLIDEDEGTFNADVDAVIHTLNSIESADWNNPVAMRMALADLGFHADGTLSGPAENLTYGWSERDKQKLISNIGMIRYDGPEMSDDLVAALNSNPNYELTAADIARGGTKLDHDRFTFALDWAEEQIAAGRLSRAEAYNILAANGYQDEMEKYIPDQWHEAVFEGNHVPLMFQQAGGAQLAMWEEMDAEQQAQLAKAMWDDMSDDQKSEMFDSKSWWMFDPTVYRTFGQTMEQQFAAIIPGLAADLISGGVKAADMISANITGRPEMWDTTQTLMKGQELMQRYGLTYDNVNGSQFAQVTSDVASEIARMYILGSIGGKIGEGTKLGQTLSAISEGANSGVVRKVTGLALDMLKSSPFVVSATAHNYSEAKALGATNSEATGYAVITGMAEGVLEGMNFDKLWGKALGQNAIAEELLNGANQFKNMGVIAKARLMSMVVSGLGEFTEESVGYALETYLKTKSIWGEGTEWSASDWIQQAGMGFLTAFFGSGMAVGAITENSIISDYILDNVKARPDWVDVGLSDVAWDAMPEATRAQYEEGGARILSASAYDQLLNQVKVCMVDSQNVIDSYKKTEAAEKAKLDESLLVIKGYAGKAQAVDVSDASKVGEFVNLVHDKLGVSIDFDPSTPLTPEILQQINDQTVAALDAKIKDAYDVYNTATANALAAANTKLENAEAQLKDLQSQLREHYAGIYLMNEGATPGQAFKNMMNAYQNGFKVEGKAAQTVDTKTENATETNATAETSKDEASVAAREAAYDRVYTDQEAGKAYGEETKNKKGSKLTRVEFAENERQNFQAKTTAKQGKVTLELAGLEAAEGMSDKEIIAEAKKAMTPDAAKKLDVYMKLSKALGLPMVIRDVVAGTSGYVHDGKLYVTLNGKQALLRVTAHELTHYMKDHVRTGYDALRTRLIENVGGQTAFDELVQKKAQEYALDLSTDKGRLEADDEVCAELCEKMFENKDALEKFVNEAPEAAKTLKARLAKTLVAIKQAIKSLGTSNSETNGDLIKDQDTIELWYKTLSDAIDAANAEAKGKVQPTIEDAATETETSTEAQPQAPPAPEGVEDLGISAEEVRKQNLRSELEELAKKGTKVKDFDRASVNEILDRVIVGDRANYSKADYAQIRGMLAQLIPEVQAMVNGDENVDIDALNERVTAALDYMLEKYHEGSEDYYGLRDIIPNKIALSDTAYNEIRSKDMTLRQASNELRKALGGKFVSFVYKKSPDYKAATKIDELWRNITDLYGEQNGIGNVSEDALALIDFVNERNTQSSFDDLYKSQHEDVVSSQVGEFLDAVQSAVDAKNARKAALHKIDDDYMPLAEKQKNGTLTKEDESKLRKMVDDAAKAAGYTTERYHGGTANNVFDTSRGDLENMARGAGTYFAKDKGTADTYAKLYGGKAKRYYLNTENYFGEKYYDDMRDASDAYRSLRKMFDALGYDGNVFSTDSVMYFVKKYRDRLSEIGVNPDREKRAGTMQLLNDVLRLAGFDGYVEDDITVAFNPDTIKSSDTIVRDDDGNIIPLSERFRTDRTGDESWKNKDVRYSIDEDYMPLAERYDAGLATEAETKQLGKDVSQAAEEAGYTELWAHGTPSASFYSFDLRKARGAKAIFLSDLGVASQYASTTYRPISTASIGRQVETVDEALSEFRRIEDMLHQPRKTESGWTIPRSTYITTSGRNLSDAELIQSANELKEKRAGGVYLLFVRPGNKLTVDANGAWWDRIRSPYGTTTDQIGEWARTHGYDSVEIENVHDGGFNNAIPQDIMMVFNPNDVKSTDLVTYDKDGDIIPLSERFDPNKTDIRWSVDEDYDAEEDAVVKQKITSRDTSLRQVAGLFKDKNAKFGETNIDIGGGKYDEATNYLHSIGTDNMVFDPFNRDEENNRSVLSFLTSGNKADTATCSNVLNVIAEDAARDNVILEAAKSIKPDGTAYFTVYEGDGSGVGRETSKGWQNNRKTADYVDEISKYFNDVTRKGKLIIAKDPKSDLPKALWEVAPGKGIRYSLDDDALPEFTDDQLKNRERNLANTVVGSPLKTLQGSTIKRYKNTVGKQVGDQIYLHKDYVGDVIPAAQYNDAVDALYDYDPNFSYNCVVYDPKKGTIRFDEAPDFDTAREPVAGKYITVDYKDGEVVDEGESNRIWHHKWLWVKDDYAGFNVRDSWEWSKRWLNELRPTNAKISNRGIANGSGIGTALWNRQLEYFGLPADTPANYTVDDDWDEAVRRYGAKPQGMNPRARDVQVPERLNRQSRLSDFLRSLTESGKVTDDQVNDIKKMVVEQNYMSYIPTSVSERMEQAQKYIAQRQPLQAQQEFHDMVTEGKGGANTVALGIQLLSDAAERGDIESVLDTAADLQILATDSGQSVQAFSVLKQLKGVGSAWYMQKLVDRLNSKYADRIAAGKMDTITVSPELMAQLAAATNVNEIEAAEEAVAKEIAGQLPLTWTDRLSNWRYFSMLANPVTHFRNIFGNVLMGGMNMAKDVVATGLERTLNVAEEDRAHAVLTAEDRKTWGDWAQKSYDENARNLRGGGKLGFETFVKQNMRKFDTKFFDALAKFNFDKLEGEDIRFIRPAYKNALMQYMKAQGYTLNAQGEVGKYAADGTFTPISNAKMTEAEEWASNQAWKATFRDASDLATMLNKVSKMNSVSRLLVEGVMPFKKTPINIAKRGIEYSPAGIVMGVAQLTNGVKKGKYTPAQAIDTLASGLTGSALMALGVFLAKLGVIRGGGEDKKKYETYLEDTGDQTYAFKIGDVSINMSSIAPATIPLFMGVALEEMLNRQGDSFDLSTFTDTIAGTLNPLMEMSFMSSLNSALQNYNNNGIGGALGNTVLTAAQNYGSQYLPTAVARLGQLADPVQRTTKSSATSPIGGNMDYYVRSLAKKVPGATTALEPDVNVWGQTNTKDTFGEWLLDVANKFVLPTNVKITNRDAVDKELIRLVESTGGVDFLPSDGNKYFTVNGQTYKMNARQYTEFSKERGEASYAAIKEVMNSPAYVNANDTQRADMLEKALKAAQKQVNTNWKYKLGAFD